MWLRHCAFENKIKTLGKAALYRKEGSTLSKIKTSRALHKLGHSKSYSIPQFITPLMIPHPLASYEDLPRISHVLLQANQ